MDYFLHDLELDAVDVGRMIRTSPLVVAHGLEGKIVPVVEVLRGGVLDDDGGVGGGLTNNGLGLGGVSWRKIVVRYPQVFSKAVDSFVPKVSSFLGGSGVFILFFLWKLWWLYGLSSLSCRLCQCVFFSVYSMYIRSVCYIVTTSFLFVRVMCKSIEDSHTSENGYIRLCTRPWCTFLYAFVCLSFCGFPVLLYVHVHFFVNSMEH